MLKLSLHEFYALYFNLEDLSNYYGFKEEDFSKIQVYLGDPDKDGKVGLEISYPRYYTEPENVPKPRNWGEEIR